MAASLAAAVVRLFEHTIALLTAVAASLPIMAGQSGDMGAQALAVTMRGLSLRECRVPEARHVRARELIIGVVNGPAIAVETGQATLLAAMLAGS